MTDHSHQYHIEELRFPNGAGLYVLNLPESPVAALQLSVATGSVHEGENIGCGLSHFLEHMLFQGTKHYPGNAVSTAVGGLGGDNNAFTSYYQTVYHIQIPAGHLRKGLDILSDMAMFPTFPADKFASEKQVILHEQAMRCDMPENMLYEETLASIFLTHPLRHPIVGYKDKIEEVSREMMMEYFNLRYRPHLCDFVVVGPVTGAQVYRMLENKLANWERGSMQEIILPTEPEQRRKREKVCYYDDPLTRIQVGVRIPPGDHRDIPALEILSGIVGENSSSRLVRELDRKSELCVDSGSSIYPMSGDGALLFTAVATPRKHEKMRKRLFEILDEVRRNGVTPAELEREKHQQIAIAIREMRTAEELAMQVSASLSRCRRAIAPDERIADYENVTLEDVNRVAAQYLDTSRFNVVDELRKPERRRRYGASKSATSAVQSGQYGELRTVTLKQERVPLTNIALIMPAGVCFETRENCGISQLAANMVLSGAGRFNEETLSEFMDDYAIESGEFCGYTSNLFHFNAPAEFQDQLFEAVAAIFTSPHWSRRSFEREKQNLLDHLTSSELNPIRRGIIEGRKLLYGDHPAGLPRQGLAEAVENLSFEECFSFFRRGFRAGRVVAGVSGKFDDAKAEKFFSSLASNLLWEEENPLKLPPEPEFATQSAHLAIPLPRRQCAVVCVLKDCSNLSEDRYVFDLLRETENGLSSQLFKLVREDNSLAYSTGMTGNRGFFAGCCCFYAMTDPDKAGRTRELLCAEIRRLGTEGLSKREFSDALNAVKIQKAEELSVAGSALTSAVITSFYHQKLMSLDEQIACYESLTLEKVNATLRKYFRHIPEISVFAGGTLTEEAKER